MTEELVKAATEEGVELATPASVLPFIERVEEEKEVALGAGSKKDVDVALGHGVIRNFLKVIFPAWD